MKLFYVVEENYMMQGGMDARLIDYRIKEAFPSFLEAAEYVNDVYVNKNRRGAWKRCAGGEDTPVHSIRRESGGMSVRMYVRD